MQQRFLRPAMQALPTADLRSWKISGSRLSHSAFFYFRRFSQDQHLCRYSRRYLGWSGGSGQGIDDLCNPAFCVFDLAESRRPKRRYSLWWWQALPFSLAIVLLWQISARHYYPDDYGYFIQINVTERGSPARGNGFVIYWRSAMEYGSSENMKSQQSLRYVLARLRSVGSFVLNPLSKVSIVYLVIYILSLSAVAYSPSRYFLPLLVPIAVLGAVACDELIIQLLSVSPTRWLALVPPIVLVAVNGIRRVGDRELFAPPVLFVQDDGRGGQSDN